MELGTQLSRLRHSPAGVLSLEADRGMGRGRNSPCYRYLLSLDSCHFAVGDLPSCQLSENWVCLPKVVGNGRNPAFKCRYHLTVIRQQVTRFFFKMAVGNREVKSFCSYRDGKKQVIKI